MLPKDFLIALRGIGQAVAAYAGRWVFWQALIRIWLVLLVLFAALEVPAFLRSVEVDKERVAEIVEGRKRFSGQAVARVFDLGSRILSSTDVIESRTLLNVIRTRNPSFPGIVGLAVIRPSRDGPGWTIDQESARSEDMLLSRLLSHGPVAQLLSQTRIGGKPRMTRLFQVPSGSGEGDRTLVVFAYQMPAEPGPATPIRPGALVVVLDTSTWVEEHGMPEALKVIHFYLSNEPPDGIFVSLNSPPEKPGAVPPPFNPVELGPVPEDPIRDLDRWRSSTPRAAPVDPVPPRPSIRARTRVILFDGFEDQSLRIHVDIPQKFLQSRSRLLVLRNLPLRLALTTIISVLLAFMWVLFSAGNQQMRRLSEAQQTIERLNLHRTMIQQELHDHIIQNLTMLGIQVAAASPKDQEGFQNTRNSVLKQLDYLRGELRRLLMDGTQRLGSFDEMVSQIRSICRHLESQSAARCELKASNPDGCTLSPEILFRSCRFVEELISNAVRHGAARRVEITIGTDAARAVLQIEVSDDGNGFDPADYRPGFGLQSMAAYARRSHGALRLNRRQPRGMTVELVVPFGPQVARTA